MTTPPSGDTASADDSTRVDWDAEEEAAEHERRGDPAARRRWWIIGILGVVATSVLAVVWGLSATQGRVHWNDAGHVVVSDEQVDVRFDITRDPSRAVVCELEALDSQKIPVGRLEVTLEPEERSPSRHVVSVRTAAPAITGTVGQCWYADEDPRY